MEARDVLRCDACGKHPWWSFPREGDPCPDDDGGHLVAAGQSGACSHPDFEANVSVGRIASDEDAVRHDEIDHFVCDVTIRCAVCKEPFGFRVPDVGVLPDRPAVSPDALEMRVPLISPSELTLLGPLAAMRAGKGIGYSVRVHDDG